MLNQHNGTACSYFKMCTIPKRVIALIKNQAKVCLSTIKKRQTIAAFLQLDN